MEREDPKKLAVKRSKLQSTHKVLAQKPEALPAEGMVRIIDSSNQSSGIAKLMDTEALCSAGRHSIWLTEDWNLNAFLQNEIMSAH